MPYTIEVKGMTCSHCEEAVKDTLEELDGVSEVVVHLDAGKVDVSYEENRVSLAQIKEAIEDQGYDVVA